VSRIAATFEALRARGQRALIPFVTAGDPQPSVTVPLMHALVGAGANVLELGVPFSDPMADGPVIQRASERALAQGMSLERVLAMVSEFRRDDGNTPVVLMGYLNPFEVAGYQSFADAAAEAGVDGILTVDLPPEEADGFRDALRARDIDLIFLLAPNSDEERIVRICAQASGFVYYVSLKGVTGAAHLDIDDVERRVQRIKALTKLPVGVGFGIRDGETAARVAAVSDAVVVGSALINIMEASMDAPSRIPGEVAALVSSMRTAMDNHP
jgi:tryptophan synthase alpha chain